MARKKTPRKLVASFTQDVVVGLLDDTGNGAPVEARFEYAGTDPFALSILFKVDPQPQRWTFARDLFIDGYYAPTGDGDVTVFPCLDGDGRATVVLSLWSPDGEAAVEVNAKTASRLIWRMVQLVPRGAEGPAFDVDATLAQLLRVASAAPSAPDAAPRAKKR